MKIEELREATDWQILGTEPYACHHCHTGRYRMGITTQDPELMKRLDIDEAAELCRLPTCHDAGGSSGN